MSETLSDNSKYLISLLRALIHERETMPEPDGVDFGKLFAIAEAQGLSCMLYHALYKLGMDRVDPSTADMLRKTHMAYVQHSVNQELEYYKAAAAFEANGIDYMPLKGWYTRELYPDPVMRYMGDIDILIRPEASKRVNGIMLALGYNCESFMQHDDDTYRKGGVMVEIHRMLDTEGLRDPALYRDPFALASESESNGHCRRMGLENAYLYTLVHGMKHFMYGGTGLRTLLDIYLYLKQERIKNTHFYIENCAGRMGISSFVSNMERLAERTFGSAEPVAEGELDEDSISLINFLLCSGSGGKSSTLDMALLDRSGKGGKGGSRRSYLFRMIFPTLASMKKRDPILKKAPVLLPVMYVRRWLQLIFTRRDHLKNSIERYNAIEDSAVDDLRRIHRLAGLE